MTTINVYLGKNVQLLKFQNGGGVEGFTPNKVTLSLSQDTARVIPEACLHDSVFAENLVRDIEHCLGVWNMHISTHSQTVINIIGDLIDNGQIDHKIVKIFLLNDHNDIIIREVGFTKDGYLGEGWIAGFLDYAYDVTKTFKGKDV